MTASLEARVGASLGRQKPKGDATIGNDQVRFEGAALPPSGWLRRLDNDANVRLSGILEPLRALDATDDEHHLRLPEEALS
jgi:hypothetical protein